jgi:hypothetical protein
MNQSEKNLQKTILPNPWVKKSRPTYRMKIPVRNENYQVGLKTDFCHDYLLMLLLLLEIF